MMNTKSTATMLNSEKNQSLLKKQGITPEELRKQREIGKREWQRWMDAEDPDSPAKKRMREAEKRYHQQIADTQG